MARQSRETSNSAPVYVSNVEKIEAPRAGRLELTQSIVLSLGQVRPLFRRNLARKGTCGGVEPLHRLALVILRDPHYQHPELKIVGAAVDYAFGLPARGCRSSSAPIRAPGSGAFPALCCATFQSAADDEAW